MTEHKAAIEHMLTIHGNLLASALGTRHARDRDTHRTWCRIARQEIRYIRALRAAQVWGLHWRFWRPEDMALLRARARCWLAYMGLEMGATNSPELYAALAHLHALEKDAA